MDPTWPWDQCVPWWGSCASPPIFGPVAGSGRGSGALVEHPQGKSTAVCGGTVQGTAQPSSAPSAAAARCRRTFQGGWRGASAAGQGKGPFMEAFLH